MNAPNLAACSDSALTEAVSILQEFQPPAGDRAIAWALTGILIELRAAREERERDAAGAYAPTVGP